MTIYNYNTTYNLKSLQNGLSNKINHALTIANYSIVLTESFNKFNKSVILIPLKINILKNQASKETCGLTGSIGV